jgi:hypothetical protein
MHEDIATSNFAQENTFGCIVEKVGIFSGNDALIPETHSQEKMLDTSDTSIA